MQTERGASRQSLSVEQKEKAGVAGDANPFTFNKTLGALHAERVRRLKAKTQTVFSFGHAVAVEELPGLCLGSILWDGARVLLRYLEGECERQTGSRMLEGAVGEGGSLSSSSSLLQGKEVLELGSGTGLLGIGAALSGLPRRVTLTDIPAVLPLLRANVERNCSRHNLSGSSESPSPSQIEIRPLDWTLSGDVDALFQEYCCKHSSESSGNSANAEEASASASPFDVVLAADVVYSEPLFVPLVECLLRVCGPQTVVLLAYQQRGQEEKKFFDLLDQYFERNSLLLRASDFSHCDGRARGPDQEKETVAVKTPWGKETVQQYPASAEMQNSSSSGNRRSALVDRERFSDESGHVDGVGMKKKLEKISMEKVNVFWCTRRHVTRSV